MNLLIVEAVPGSSDTLSAAVARSMPRCEIQVAPVGVAQEAVDASRPDLVFMVAAPGGGETLSFVREMRARGLTVPVIAVVAENAARSVREALRAGAQDVLFESEIRTDSPLRCLEAFRQRQRLSDDISRASRDALRCQALVGDSAAMRKVRRMVGLVAASQSPVLIVGETGTGKGLVARAIHEAGPRRHLEFRAVNCAATPASLMESVMYGHERGSFTGAFRRQRGQFELVGGGTILLDEVAEVPIELQPKLLRAVEERFFQPIGAEKELAFGGRILASTNADLAERMASGRFRPDLYYRLGVLRVSVPSLSQRAEDIPALTDHFAREAQPPVRLSQPATRWLSERRWPGNVRELRNAIERLSVLFPGQEVGLAEVKEHIDEDFSRSSAEIERAARILGDVPGGLKGKVAALEAALVRSALRDADGNRSAAARALHVDRRVIDRLAPRTPNVGRDDAGRKYS